MEEAVEELMDQAGQSSDQDDWPMDGECSGMTSAPSPQRSLLDAGNSTSNVAKNKTSKEPSTVKKPKKEETKKPEKTKTKTPPKKTPTEGVECKTVTRPSRSKKEESIPLATASFMEYLRQFRDDNPEVEPENLVKMAIDKYKNQTSIACKRPKAGKRRVPKRLHKNKKSNRMRRRRKLHRIAKPRKTRRPLARRRPKQKQKQNKKKAAVFGYVKGYQKNNQNQGGCIKKGLMEFRKMVVAQKQVECCKKIAAKCMAKSLSVTKAKNQACKPAKTKKNVQKNKGTDYYVRILPVFTNDK